MQEENTLEWNIAIEFKILEERLVKEIFEREQVNEKIRERIGRLKKLMQKMR